MVDSYTFIPGLAFKWEVGYDIRRAVISCACCRALKLFLYT